MSRARGVTLLDVLLAMTLVGAVATIAVPKYADLKRGAVASEILTDVETVRAATYSFYSDSGYFPVEVGDGNIPTNLTAYLPVNYSFRKRYGQLDYENWSLKYRSVRSKSPVVIGVTVTPVEAKVGMSAFAMYGDSPKFALGGKYTFILIGM